jgi:segregation and condensation protein B
VPDNTLEPTQIKRIVEAALMCADEPLPIERLTKVFRRGEANRDLIRAAIDELEQDCAGRSYELKRVASGYRFQVGQDMSEWVSRLWEERPPRYSRALMETLALIAYRQPVTRGDIEQVRGVAVSSNIVRTLLEREWIRVVGYKEVPGRPAMYGTTKAFLDYFNLQSLVEMPPLAEVRALVEPELADEAALAGGPDPEISMPLAVETKLEPAEVSDESEVSDDADEANEANEPTVVLPRGGAEIVPLPNIDRSQ